MLKQDGIITLLTAPTQGACRGMKVASQQVRQYDITPPPVAKLWGYVWRNMPPAFTFKRPGVVPSAAIAAPSAAFPNPLARALAPDFFRRFRRFRVLNLFAPVSILNPSCRLG